MKESITYPVILSLEGTPGTWRSFMGKQGNDYFPWRGCTDEA